MTIVNADRVVHISSYFGDDIYGDGSQQHPYETTYAATLYHPYETCALFIDGVYTARIRVDRLTAPPKVLDDSVSDDETWFMEGMKPRRSIDWGNLAAWTLALGVSAAVWAAIVWQVVTA